MTPDDADYIFTQLRFPPDASMLDDLKNAHSVERNGYIFKKSFGSQSGVLIISAK